MTDEQLRAAIMDIVTDAWDRSRQIDGAVDEIMDAVALAIQHPSQSAGVVLQGDRDDPPDVSLIADPTLREVVTAYGNGPHYEGLRRVAELLRQSQSVGEPVAYLDIGVGGYLDLGSDLSDEQFARLPPGRHMLGIIGTYGADGYTPASPPPTDAARADMGNPISEAARATGDGATQAEVVAALEGLCKFNEMAGMPTTRAREVLAKIAAGGIVSPAEPNEEPSEKQRKLLDLADRIDYERLCLRPGMTHRDMTPEQRDRMNAGVELRRYAQIWKAGRWIVIPPVGPVRFSANTLDRAVEMAKRDEERRGATPAEPDAARVEADRRDAAVPDRTGIYAWNSGPSAALVLVDKRPSHHAPGGQFNGHVIASAKFYDGCPVTQWGKDGRWTLLHDFDAALAAERKEQA